MRIPGVMELPIPSNIVRYDNKLLFRCYGRCTKGEDEDE